MNKNFFAACITSFFLLASSLHAQPQHSERFPQRVVLNVTAKPASSMAVTWRTAQQIVLPKVQVARTGQWSDFDKQARTLIALSNTMRTDRKELAWYYSAIMDSLSPGTFYAYRVGGDSIWSEWNQFTTASTKADPFRFVYFGDPQND
jgi:hypothetical protein